MRLIAAASLLILSYGAWLCRGLYPTVEWLQVSWSSVLYISLSASAGLGALLRSRSSEQDRLARSWAAFAITGSFLILPLGIARTQEARAVEHWSAQAANNAKVLQIRARQAQQEAIDIQKAALPPDRFTQYEGRVDAASLLAVRQLDQKMKAELDAAADAYRSALDRFPTRGPDEWVLFRDREQLEAEYAAHTQLYSATRAFTRAVETFEERYQKELESLSLQPPADRIAIAELQRILLLWNERETFALRQLDEAVLGAAIRVLNVLRENWGQWSYNPRDQKMDFVQPLAEQNFAEALADLLAANAAMQKLTPPD